MDLNCWEYLHLKVCEHMKKNFGKKDFIKKKTAPRLSSRLLHSKSVLASVMVVAVIFSVTLVWYVYQSQRLPSGMSGVYARLNNWMHERNHELKQNIVKVKQLAVDNKTPHQEIH